MKKIIAIGGAVIKTAKPELKKIIEDGQVEMLIHNGGSIFHDFQQEIQEIDGHSYPIDQLLDSLDVNKNASYELWDWFKKIKSAPEGSVTRLCSDLSIPVLMFTALGCDFWHLFNDDWELIARHMKKDFDTLCERFLEEFHYVCMGSAVIHPEVFIKVLALCKPEKFKADVVDFLDMYRPRTRVAKYGTYYQMKHKDYLKGLR